MAEMDDDALLAALGVEVEPARTSKRTPQEERIIAGFEDILRFHQRHGRAPQHGDDRDIFERLYAVRLDQLRRLPDARTLLTPLDAIGLLGDTPTIAEPDQLDADALLAALGVNAEPTDDDDIRLLRHVRSNAARQAAEEIAEQSRCEDFDRFQLLFESAERELKDGTRRAIPFRNEASVEPGNFFVVGGQLAYIADKGEEFETSSGQPDARLRVIYANGTESNLLMRSLQKALTRSDAGRRLTDPDAGPLFAGNVEPDDIAVGAIYVLRSRSEHPFVAEHRELIHKIGVTGGKVETRIASADKDATYLLAGVDIVAEYRLHNLSRSKLENIFHRLFAAAQLDINLQDRFGRPVKPREWFVVPLPVIDEAVERIRDGTITGYEYDPATARLSRREA